MNPIRVLFPPSLGMPKAHARAELVESSVAQALGRPVSVTVARDYNELIRSTLAREADVVWAPAGVCGRISSMAKQVFRVVRQGRTQYRSAVIVRSNSKLTIDNLGAARGVRAAWVDPHSLGGYILAQELFRRRGINPALVFGEQTFMGSHPEALAAVTDGRAELAAITAWSGEDHDVRAALTMHVGPLESRLGVLAVTDEAPTDAIVLTYELDAEGCAAFEKVLDTTPATTPAMLQSKKRTMLPSAMGADRYEPTSIDTYIQLQRRLSGSIAPPR
ncbi:MAG: PhnD/SsuA/transferrin family substrate-binding protein [Myxococcales bacterium]|nr:PhnD/SsuA/transferrin family substrate-binding protein [Myxococcales bacterium]